jgi:transcriptional regulator with XRE-family HTH domain/quercetin dioxygenase-like cupin family protein
MKADEEPQPERPAPEGGRTAMSANVAAAAGELPIDQPTKVAAGMENLGARIREIRMRNGMSLRELARRIDVSPSFISQIENGRSQPSVMTLYALSQLLGLSIDDIFEDSTTEKEPGQPLQLSPELRDPTSAWVPTAYANRVSVVHPSHRSRLDMAAGVVWERLAATPEHGVGFMKISYAPGAASTETGEMMVHPGYEYGFVLQGMLEVVIGDDMFVLRAGESMGFDSTIPHIFRNTGDEEMQGIWFVHSSAP